MGVMQVRGLVVKMSFLSIMNNPCNAVLAFAYVSLMYIDRVVDFHQWMFLINIVIKCLDTIQYF